MIDEDLNHVEFFSYAKATNKITTSTGLTQDDSYVYSLYYTSGQTHLIVIDKTNFRVVEDFHLNGVGAPHSIVHHEGKLYIVSSSNNKIFVFTLKDSDLQKYHQYGNDKMRYHVNSVTVSDGDIIISGFGENIDKNWNEITNGFIYNIDKDIVLKKDIYHPHTLTNKNNAIFYFESKENTLRSVSNNDSLKISIGYPRGMALVSDDIVVVGTSQDRHIEYSTNAIAGVSLVNVKNKEILKTCTLNEYNPEVYDVLKC